MRRHGFLGSTRLVVGLFLGILAAGASAGDVRTAADLLSALETAGDDIRTLQADISYDRRFALQGDRHVREGRLYFESRDTPTSPPPPRSEEAGGAPEVVKAPRARVFGIHFERLYVGDRLENDPQTWIFDGRWLYEVRPAQKRFVKREVARPGEAFDPLRVGEGPMPLPIGQKAGDILARYDVELLAAGEGVSPEALESLPVDCHQLRLTPRKDRTDRDEFKEIRLWYAKDGLLPRMSRTVNRAGDEAFVVLINVRVNQPVPKEALSASAPGEGAGWDVQIETLDGEPRP